jgi:putative hydrolase
MNYPVDIHSHTVASTHAYSTIHDYIAEAKRKGIRLFATTDHGPEMADAPHFWHFINLQVLPRVVDGVGILRGIEANIKNVFGEIDCSERMHEGLDIILAGFHEPVFAPSDQENHTRAMINAIRSGKVDVITHPGNTAYPIDIPAVVAAAVSHHVALEVNNSSFSYSRRGSEANCRMIVEVARDLGATLVLGSDAHVAYSLGDFSYAHQLIEETGFPPERLLNTSPERLLTFLNQRGHAPIPELAAC